MKHAARTRHRIIFATSEAHPLMKTGGLGDVSGSLPQALHALGQDIRILLPAYRDAIERAGKTRVVAKLEFPRGKVRLLETLLPGSKVKVLLVDCPECIDRPGNPYSGPDGAWPDNARRFALFNDVLSAISMDRAGLSWAPDIFHGNDWQTGLAPALISREPERPATVFTIHNLAYQGLFPHESFHQLALPPEFWNPGSLEFYGQLSFMKGGLAYADRITTVSPTYAREIQTAEFGNGLDGLLRHRNAVLSGILNGIDVDEWNPATDPHITRVYSYDSLEAKAENKLALQAELHLPQGSDLPLLSFIGRLVDQKGVDLILGALPELMSLGTQVVVLGSGQPELEHAWRQHAECNPNQLAVRIGHDEALAHRIEAGADIFLMPSRFEPCGLNQMYSQRYGTIPIVRKTGGLADTVTHADDGAVANGTATGVAFEHSDVQGLLWAIRHTLQLYREKKSWRRMQIEGMKRDYSWAQAGHQYVRLYDEVADPRAKGLG